MSVSPQFDGDLTIVGAKPGDEDALRLDFLCQYQMKGVFWLDGSVCVSVHIRLIEPHRFLFLDLRRQFQSCQHAERGDDSSPTGFTVTALPRYSALFVPPLFCGARRLVSSVFWGESVSERKKRRMNDAICWLLIFFFFCLFVLSFFTFFNAIWPCMLNVQCIISQTALTGLLQFCFCLFCYWVFFFFSFFFWDLPAKQDALDLWARVSVQDKRLRVRRTAVGQLWPPLVHKGWKPSGSGRPACRPVQSSKPTSWNYKVPLTSSWTWKI